MLFDTILTAFVSALIGGFAVLHVYSLPLLALVAQLAWIRGMYPLIRAGIHPGEVWAHAILMVLSIAAYIYILANFRTLSTMVFQIAADLGARASGGGITGAQLMRPSEIFTAGAASVTPLHDFMLRFKGLAALKNLHVILEYGIAYWIVIAAFIGICLSISLTIIEFHFAALCATVLVPWAPLGVTAFLAEFAIAWTAGMAVRMLIQTAVVGISLPLVDTLVLTTTAGGDPDFWGALAVVGGAVLFFILAWQIPNRATSIVARGAALAIGSDAVLAGLSSAARGIRGAMSAGQQVVTGATSMMKAMAGKG